jgi:uncharacterized membrane protein YGL010W
MKTVKQWFDEYGESHQNQTNKLIHYLCVPAIYMTVFGLLWSVPFPDIGAPVWVNWATLLAIPALLFYFLLSFKIGIGMTAFSVAVVYFITWWQHTQSMSVLTMSLLVFVVAWILQFIGHHIEGKKPSFFKDLQFLLIGPAWILGFVYKKANIQL